MTSHEGLAVPPANYDVVDGAVVFRTAPATPALAAEREVAFEVDRIDEALSEGWSVLVNGPAVEVTDPDVVSGLRAKAHTRPWAGGGGQVWLRIELARLTGRRITAA